MSEKINCCLIKDLLPSYIDELCAEQSRKLIEEHLKDCPDCRATFEAMKDDEKPVEKVAVDDAAIIKKANEKMKKDINKRTIPAIIVCVVLVLVIIAMLVPFKSIPEKDINITLSYCNRENGLRPLEEDDFFDEYKQVYILADDKTDPDKANFMVADFGKQYGVVYLIDIDWYKQYTEVTVVDIQSDYFIKNYDYDLEDNGSVFHLTKAGTSIFAKHNTGEYDLPLIFGGHIDETKIR